MTQSNHTPTPDNTYPVFEANCTTSYRGYHTSSLGIFSTKKAAEEKLEKYAIERTKTSSIIMQRAAREWKEGHIRFSDDDVGYNLYVCELSVVGIAPSNAYDNLVAQNALLVAALEEIPLRLAYTSDHLWFNALREWDETMRQPALAKAEATA